MSYYLCVFASLQFPNTFLCFPFPAGWPASFGPFAFWALCFFLCTLSIKNICPRNRSIEKGPKQKNNRLFWARFDEQCVPFQKSFKTTDVRPFHIDAQHRLVTSIDAPQPHLSQIPSVYKHVTCEMVRSAQDFFAIEKMAAQGMSIKKIATTLGLPQSTTKRWLCRSKAQRKNVIQHACDTPLHPSTDTDNTTDTSNTFLLCTTVRSNFLKKPCNGEDECVTAMRGGAPRSAMRMYRQLLYGTFGVLHPAPA